MHAPLCRHEKEKMIDNEHAEIAPPLEKEEECWYLPVFVVYHPRKPDHIRGVFNSSVKFNGVSLNSVLLSGPNMTNSLLGITSFQERTCGRDSGHWTDVLRVHFAVCWFLLISFSLQKSKPCVSPNSSNFGHSTSPHSVSFISRIVVFSAWYADLTQCQ